jgi:Gluconate 2-dehydrogenase subunit 3
MTPLPTHPDVETLTALANAIIPPDHRDAGAASVAAGPRLAERMPLGPHSGMYSEGLQIARELAAQVFGRPIVDLSPTDLHELMRRLAERAPAFFRQLRLDTAALYLSDPGVWERIGFPGPSIDAGGYPDFDQPQEQISPPSPAPRRP